MTCKCKRMEKLMVALGAKQAAAMHGQLDKEWSNRQWLVHFKEEEIYVFPVMLKLGMVNEVRKLGADHNRYRDMIASGRKIPKADIDRHAKLEDEYVLRLEPYVLGKQAA